MVNSEDFQIPAVDWNPVSKVHIINLISGFYESPQADLWSFVMTLDEEKYLLHYDPSINLFPRSLFG